MTGTTATATPSTKAPFDIISHYQSLLDNQDVRHPFPSPPPVAPPSHLFSCLTLSQPLPAPLATIESLCSLLLSTPTSTTSELLLLLSNATDQLSQAAFNPISLQAGAALFKRFLTLQRPNASAEGEKGFGDFKQAVCAEARLFVEGAKAGRERIAREMSQSGLWGERGEMKTVFIHSYSRVVIQAILFATQIERRPLRIYITESRPYGLGLKSHAVLTNEKLTYPIECQVVLDSAVAYTMGKCDLCIVGAETVCESGGLVNFIGGYQLAIAAKAWGKPLYALAESYKFCRVFPLSQYDLPTSLPTPPLTFPGPPPFSKSIPPTPTRPMLKSPMPKPLEMTEEMVLSQPVLDYTDAELVKFVVSDLGVMTPSGVSDTLLSIFGGE